jgi:hypothetical protein
MTIFMSFQWLRGEVGGGFRETRSLPCRSEHGW